MQDEPQQEIAEDGNVNGTSFAPTIVPSSSLEVTAPSEWKRKAKARHLIRLPSGNVAKVRYPDFTDLILRGAVAGDEMLSMQPVMPGDPDSYERIYQLAKKVIPYIMVYPVVLSPGQEAVDGQECLTVDDFSRSDAVSMLYWSMGLNTLPTRELDEL